MKPEMLAAAHWGYVESVLQLHGEQLDVIEKCGEHYKAAFVHGFKHGIESLSENSADKGSKIAVTRIYGARGADVFAEGMLSIHGDLIKIEGSRDMEITPDEAARLGKELVRLARIGGWIDQEESD
jgi:hypothetical protein